MNDELAAEIFIERLSYILERHPRALDNHIAKLQRIIDNANLKENLNVHENNPQGAQ
jgi:hypothetical protein